MFGRVHTISLHHVRDTVKVTEGSESLMLKVDADPMRLTAALNLARARLQGITQETPEEEGRAAAQFFAECIFGAEQAEKMMAFYNNDPLCVMNVCGQYFRTRLNKLIEKAQKNAK